MGWFNQYPYEDNEELNLDYLLAKVAALKGMIDETNAQIDAFNSLLVNKADKTTTLYGYGITDAYTKTETDNLLVLKADKTNVYNKTEVDNLLLPKVNASNLAPVAITGNYTDLINKPTFVAQVNSDWNANSGVAQILNKPTIPQGTVTSVETGTGLTGGPITSSGTISTYVPSVTQNCNTLPPKNSIDWNEYSPSSANLPEQSWFHITSIRGSDNNYGTQIAVGVTGDRIYYRRYQSGTFGAWLPVIPKWNVSGNWQYWKDAGNRWHLFYKSGNVTHNFNGTIGSLKYNTTPTAIAFPITLSNVISAQVTLKCANDIVGGAISNYTSTNISIWEWGAGSGNHTIEILLDILAT